MKSHGSNSSHWPFHCQCPEKEEFVYLENTLKETFIDFKNNPAGQKTNLGKDFTNPLAYYFFLPESYVGAPLSFTA